MKKLSLKITAAMIAGIGLFATSVSAANRTVNCDEGQSIQDALEKGRGSAAELYIDVSGSCEEVVTIKRDDVTIDGGETATVIGSILVEGGRRISINEITITGGGVGIEGGDLKLTNVVITENSVGVLAVESSHVSIFDSTIENNRLAGIVADVGSNVFVRYTSISEHDEFGIILYSNSTAKVGRSKVNGNNIGISVRDSSSLSVGNTDIANNSSTGIETDNGASVVVDNNSTIGSNAGGGIDADLHSSVLIGDSSITNNGNVGIKLQSDSGVRINPNVIVSGNGFAGEFCDNAESCGVFCGDIESSVLDLSDIADEVECTDFNQLEP